MYQQRLLLFPCPPNKLGYYEDSVGAAGAALGGGVTRYYEDSVGQLGPHWGVVL